MPSWIGGDHTRSLEQPDDRAVPATYATGGADGDGPGESLPADTQTEITGKINILIVKGVAGLAVYINEIRVCGPKPWGGGETIAEWNIEEARIQKALKGDL